MARLSGQCQEDILIARGSVEVCMNTKEADLLTRRLEVKREVDLADALTNNVLNDGNTVEIASLDVVVESVASW
jgi:hypothetical protein